MNRCDQCGRPLETEGTCCHSDLCVSCEDWNTEKLRDSDYE